MNRPELTPYHRELAETLKLEPDRAKRQEFLSHERTTKRYKFAKAHIGARVSSLIKEPLLPEEAWYLSKDDKDDRTKELVDVMLTSAFENLDEQEKVVSWAEESYERYSGLPERTVGQKKIVTELVRTTAVGLLKNIRHVNVIDERWRRQQARIADAQEPQESFSERVKNDSLTLIKEKWRDVKPEQLAQLVRIYADNKSPHQGFAKEMLINYFKGPPNRLNQRMAANYKFVTGLLDLIDEEDDISFREGMKVALYATDILPKCPSLPEQAVMLSLPHNEEPDSFRETLAVNYVLRQLRFIGLHDFEGYYADIRSFVSTSKVKEELQQKLYRVEKAIGQQKVRELNKKMEFFFVSTGKLLLEDQKKDLKNEWPFNVAFSDPLIQKFQEVCNDKSNREVASKP